MTLLLCLSSVICPSASQERAQHSRRRLVLQIKALDLILESMLQLAHEQVRVKPFQFVKI
jgi:hypothetical protein